MGEQGFLTQIWGKVVQRPGLYEFAGDFWVSFARRFGEGRVCLGEKRAFQVSQVPDEDQK